MVKEIFENISILSGHLAQNIVESEQIEQLLKSPVDLAIIAHQKGYIKRDMIGKMLDHLVAHGFLEKRGEIYSLEDEWRRSLPSKSEAISILQKAEIYQLYLLSEFLSKSFIDIVNNDQNKHSLEKLLYYIDTIDSSNGLNKIRNGAISTINFTGQPKNILDFNFGLGYSSIQLASIYRDSSVYSLQLNTTLMEAFDYTVQRYNASNLYSTTKYSSEIIDDLMKEKVDIIYAFNPLGFKNPNFERILEISSKVSKPGTKFLMFVPYTNQPINTLLAEWLAQTISTIDHYDKFEHFNVALNNHNFDVDSSSKFSRYITATFTP